MKRFFILSLMVLCFVFCIQPVHAQDYIDPAKATLAWDVPSTGGEVEGYRIKLGTASGTYTTTSADTTGLSIPVSSFTLIPKTRYFAVVVAFNEAGESDPSNEVSFVPLAKPGAPTFRVNK